MNPCRQPGFVTAGAKRQPLHDALLSGGQWVPTNDESGLSLTPNTTTGAATCQLFAPVT